VIILTRHQAAALAPLGIDFARHPDFDVWDPDALDASAVTIRLDTPDRMRIAAARTGEAQ
jgi:hypothetical protein